MENLEQDKQDASDALRTDTITIPVIEEKVSFSKNVVETGKVTVSKTIDSHTVPISEKLASEQVTVERKQLNHYVETAPAALVQRGDTTIISVVKEVLVVEKKLMLVEEIHITRHRSGQLYEENVTVQQEKIEITKTRSGTDV